MATARRPRSARSPPPSPTPRRKRFWEAAAQGKLLLKKCRACGEAHYYPRALCPFCGSDRTDWQPASGTRHDLLLQRHAAGGACPTPSPT